MKNSMVYTNLKATIHHLTFKTQYDPIGLRSGGATGGQGGDRPPKGFKKRKKENMGYFHALKLAFLSSLIRKYML